eukprot:11233172-Alexandrium_andersonii.AAC.1
MLGNGVDLPTVAQRVFWNFVHVVERSTRSLFGYTFRRPDKWTTKVCDENIPGDIEKMLGEDDVRME